MMVQWVLPLQPGDLSSSSTIHVKVELSPQKYPLTSILILGHGYLQACSHCAHRYIYTIMITKYF